MRSGIFRLRLLKAQPLKQSLSFATLPKAVDHLSSCQPKHSQCLQVRHCDWAKREKNEWTRGCKKRFRIRPLESTSQPTLAIWASKWTHSKNLWITKGLWKANSSGIQGKSAGVLIDSTCEQSLTSLQTICKLLNIPCPKTSSRKLTGTKQDSLRAWREIVPMILIKS